MTGISGYNPIQGTINVEWYNAKHDGATDDTAAAQAAINEAQAINGTVFFPAGVYKLSSQLTISGSCSLIGIGYTNISAAVYGDSSWNTPSAALSGTVLWFTNNSSGLVFTTNTITCYVEKMACIGSTTGCKTTSTFIIPAVSSTVAAVVNNSAVLTLNNYYYINNAGYFQVTAITNGTNITLKNISNTVNSPVGTIVALNSGFGAALTRGFSSTAPDANLIYTTKCGFFNFWEGYNPGAMENFSNLDLLCFGCAFGIRSDAVTAGAECTDNRFYNIWIESCGTGIYCNAGDFLCFYGGLLQDNITYAVHLVGPGPEHLKFDCIWFEGNGGVNGFVDPGTGPSFFFDTAAGSLTDISITNCHIGGDLIAFQFETISGNFVNELNVVGNFLGATAILASNCYQAYCAGNNGHSVINNSNYSYVSSQGLVNGGTGTAGVGTVPLASFSANQFIMNNIPITTGTLSLTYGNQPGGITSQGMYKAGYTIINSAPALDGYWALVNLRDGYSGIPSANWRNQPVINGYTLLPDVDNGHCYVCTTPGTCANSAPSFNTGPGSTTTDGTAIWTEAGPGAYWRNFGFIS